MGAIEKHDGLAIPGRVVLAHEPPFTLGALRINPPLREVRNGERRQIIEPRVMQVLVALARAGGEIMTRDELVDACWNGRIVGDDAVNRVLSRIRRLGIDFAESGFRVETIPRVGYRLAQEPAAEPSPAAAPSARGMDRRRVMAGTAALVVLGGIGTAGIWRAGTRGSTPPEARMLYDRALVIRQNGGPAENRQAIAHLREAVRLSPGYGEAWGALALAYRSAIHNEAPERVAGLDERLREAIRNAEFHDPGNPDAAIAKLPTWASYGRWAEAEAAYRSVIRRNPDHGGTHMLLGSVLMEVGRWSDAVAALRAAKARNPASALGRYRLAMSLWSAGHLSAAEDEIDEAMRLWPQHGAIWQTKIKLLALTGRPRAALAFASDPGSMPIDEVDAPDKTGRALFLTALITRAAPDIQRSIESIVARARAVELDRVTAALQAVALGRTALALDLLEGVYLGSGEWRLEQTADESLSTHPMFQPHARPLWQEPRFTRILAAVGLEGYWRRTGTRPDYRRT